MYKILLSDDQTRDWIEQHGINTFMPVHLINRMHHICIYATIVFWEIGLYYSSEYIYVIFNLKTIETYWNNWHEHILRMPNNRLPKELLNYRPIGRRDSGRPNPWIDDNQWKNVCCHHDHSSDHWGPLRMVSLSIWILVTLISY